MPKKKKPQRGIFTLSVVFQTVQCTNASFVTEKKEDKKIKFILKVFVSQKGGG